MHKYFEMKSIEYFILSSLQLAATVCHLFWHSTYHFPEWIAYKQNIWNTWCCSVWYCLISFLGLTLSSTVALIFTPFRRIFLPFRRIVSSLVQFTCNINGPSNILSHSSCYCLKTALLSINNWMAWCKTVVSDFFGYFFFLQKCPNFCMCFSIKQ